jgi:hypothetical protein
MDPDQTARMRRLVWIHATAQAGLDSCWSQMHYVGLVVTRLTYIFMAKKNGRLFNIQHP